MKNVLSLGRIGGIRITIHWTFLFLIGWIIYLNWRSGNTPIGTLWSIAFVLLVFGCVVLHELGHAMAARQFGIRTRSITLLPIGGLASLDSLPEKPKEELIVSIAGPLVNILIALLLYPFVKLPQEVIDESLPALPGGNFLFSLFSVNILLAVFNLIPAFPMDGGRVLRALLSFRFDHALATRISASIGQVIAIAFVLLGLLYNPFLVFIGFFIFLSAQAEAGYSQTEKALKGFTVGDVMSTRYQTIGNTATLREAVQLLLGSQSKSFLVMDGDHPVGTLGRNEIMKFLAEEGKECTVEKAMHTNLISFQNHTPLNVAWAQMQQNRLELAPVYIGHELLGVIDTENILEFILIQNAGSKFDLRMSRKELDKEYLKSKPSPVFGNTFK